MQPKFRVIIPAGGRSSRSGLAYPKTLYPLSGVPILIRILDKVARYDARPLLVINPSQEELFRDVLRDHGKEVDFVYQHEPKGMGNAILQAADKLGDDEHIILLWSDIPLLSDATIHHMVNCHVVSRNVFSLVTSIGSNCYTIAERDENGSLQRVLETRALGIKPAEYGERDIGLFVFRKQPVFGLLAEDAAGDYSAGKNEHGFLYVIEKLVEQQYKVEGYPIAVPNDVLSFNTPEDLRQIENAVT